MTGSASERPRRVSGLVLAAGSGSRFDPGSPASKMTVAVDGAPMALRSAQALRAVIADTLVVVREDWLQAVPLRALLERIEAAGIGVTLCVDAASGMGHSLAWGVAEAVRRFDPDAIVVALADMPFVTADTLQRIVAAPAGAIVAPRVNGQRGHPVRFERQHYDALRELSGDRGAVSLLKTQAVHWIDVDDVGVVRDIDRQEDLDADRLAADPPADPPADRPSAGPNTSQGH